MWDCSCLEWGSLLDIMWLWRRVPLAPRLSTLEFTGVSWKQLSPRPLKRDMFIQPSVSPLYQGLWGKTSCDSTDLGESESEKLDGVERERARE